jgi:hypothetical protein
MDSTNTVSSVAAISQSCCSDARCAAVVAETERHRIRERLQILESWKLGAEQAELDIIGEYEEFLRYELDHEIPTDMCAPGWFAERAEAGDYDD